MSFCIRNNLRFHELTEIIRTLLIEESIRELNDEMERVSESKLSAMTGIHRKEVKRLMSVGEAPTQPRGLVFRVLGQWEADPEFRGPEGPRDLAVGGRDSEFAKLVEKVTRDLNPSTVLFELERVGAVTRSDDRVRLVAGHFVPKGDAEQVFAIVTRDIEDLIRTVEENAFRPSEPLQLHGRTTYDNIPAEHAREIREWMLDFGRRIHKEVREYLSKRDRDLNPEVPRQGASIQVSLGTFGHVRKLNRE